MPLDYKATLMGLLGLANTATDEEIALANSTFQSDMVAYKGQMDAMVNSAKSEAKAANDTLAAANDKIVALTNRNGELLEDLANRDIEAYKSVIADPAAVKSALISNRSETLKFLNGLKKPVESKPKADEPLHNRTVAGQPAPVAGSGGEMSEAESQWVGNRAAQLRNSIRGLSHRDSFNMARSELNKEKSK